MAVFQYTVTGAGPSMSLSGEAPDAREAQREAVLFLSGLLRDRAVADEGGSEIRIEVRGADGDLVCVATADVTDCEPH
jgi:hypothetical protein